jgi:hypothetical protein
MGRAAAAQRLTPVKVRRNGAQAYRVGDSERCRRGEQRPWRSSSNGHSVATKAPKPLDRRGVAIGATPSDAVLLPLEQDEAMRAAESSQLGGHPL